MCQGVLLHNNGCNGCTVLLILAVFLYIPDETYVMYHSDCEKCIYWFDLFVNEDFII